MTSQQVGFIGLGSMGAGMARCLLAAGHALSVFARRTDAAVTGCNAPLTLVCRRGPWASS